MQDTKRKNIVAESDSPDGLRQLDLRAIGNNEGWGN
jgi:hypothetical protein